MSDNDELGSFHLIGQTTISKVNDCNIEPPNDSTLLELAASCSTSSDIVLNAVPATVNTDSSFDVSRNISESEDESYSAVEINNSDATPSTSSNNALYVVPVTADSSSRISQNNLPIDESSTIAEINYTNDVVQNLTNEIETVVVNNSKKKKFIRKTAKRQQPQPSSENPKKALSRKRVSNPKESINNLAKKARAEGAKGVGRAGIAIKPRVIKPGCLENCRKACFNNISNEDRQLAFDQYYALADKRKQWECINNWVILKKSSNSSDVEASMTKRTSDVIQYDFRLPSSDTFVTVCRTMFLNTLGISYQCVRTAKNKSKSINATGVMEDDMRGKHDNRPFKYPEEMKESVRQHIKSIQVIDSHYCRKDTQKKYLERGLNMKRMYSMYKEHVGKKDDDPTLVSSNMYENIFNQEFNFGFFKPKKDRCEQCEGYKNSPPEDQTEIDAHECHVNSKIESRRLMRADTDRANIETTFCCANYDMQKILTTPKSEISTMYYKSKLCVWNLTIFELGVNVGLCYLWNETVGNRGSVEIASFVWVFIKNKAESGTKDLTFYTDNCGGQNRNQNNFSMYVRAANVFNVRITHRFLEVGHTQSPGDSVHGCIEKHIVGAEIFTQNEWARQIIEAKTDGTPYTVKQITQEDIFDFGELARLFNWKNAKISQLREIVVTPESNHIEVKYDYFKASKIINVLKKNVTIEQICSLQLKKAYDARIPLAPKKNDDLKSMVQKNLVPNEFISDFKEMLND